jgi:hypothetical protein
MRDGHGVGQWLMVTDNRSTGNEFFTGRPAGWGSEPELVLMQGGVRAWEGGCVGKMGGWARIGVKGCAGGLANMTLGQGSLLGD